MTQDPITLKCWTCSEPWETPRRPGQYPTRCPRCTTTELTARDLCRKAKTLGLKGEVHKHQRQGYVCIVKTPWHDHLVIVRDRIDLEWLLTELHTTSALQAA